MPLNCGALSLGSLPFTNLANALNTLSFATYRTFCSWQEALMKIYLRRMLFMISWSYKDAVEYDCPDGYYKAVIQEVTYKLSKNGAEMWVFTFKLEGVHFTPKKYQLVEPYGKCTAAMIRQSIAQIAKCFNVEEGAQEWSAFVGKRGFIKISHKERKDNPQVEEIVLSFPAPEKGKDGYLRSAQQKAAEEIAKNSASLDSWNLDEEKIPF